MQAYWTKEEWKFESISARQIRRYGQNWKRQNRWHKFDKKTKWYEFAGQFSGNKLKVTTKTKSKLIKNHSSNNYGSNKGDEAKIYDFWNDESMMLLQLGLNNNVPELKRAEAIEAMMALDGEPESV